MLHYNTVMNKGVGNQKVGKGGQNRKDEVAEETVHNSKSEVARDGVTNPNSKGEIIRKSQCKKRKPLALADYVVLQQIGRA